MWDSPIKIIYKDIDMQLEAGVIKAVQNASIYVDKDELRKALEYDRDQYRKGYEDALLNKKHGKWIDKWNTLWKQELPVCSVCNKVSIFKSDFCPNCGADMRERSEK